MDGRRSTRGWRVVAAVAVVGALLGAAFVVRQTILVGRAVHPSCQAGGYQFDVEQAANATTIAAVGKRLGLADHAVTIALAAALQESRLHNLAHGDRDSLGLFQQRPSQGWGTPTDIMKPPYAATAFYQHLALIDGWATLSVTDAAQQVQHSAAPDAYARWDAKARALAMALTGEVPAGLTCRFSTRSAPPQAGALTQAMTQAMTEELGAPGLGVAVASARGWTVAAWLVGHAWAYHLTSVDFNGQRWTPATGTWVPTATVGSHVVATSTG